MEMESPLEMPAEEMRHTITNGIQDISATA
jgi:hypothetical protein